MFLIFSQKNFSKYSGNGTFLYFSEKYIQNPDIFRTLVYSEPEGYSEYFQTSTIERSAKIARKIKKRSYIFFYFGK